MSEPSVQIRLTGQPPAVARWCDVLTTLGEIITPPARTPKRLRGGRARQWLEAALLDQPGRHPYPTGSPVQIQLIGRRADARRWVAALGEVANLHSTSDQKDLPDGQTLTFLTAELRRCPDATA